MCYFTNKYQFAIGRQIKQVFSESKLYLNRIYDEHTPFKNMSIKRIDEPIFMLLDDGVLASLYTTSFSVADGFLKEYVLGNDFQPNEKTQQNFQFLCGHTILEVLEHEATYDIDDDTYIAIVLDNGLRLICNAYFDFFDVQIIDRA